MEPKSLVAHRRIGVVHEGKTSRHVANLVSHNSDVHHFAIMRHGSMNLFEQNQTMQRHE